MQKVNIDSIELRISTDEDFGIGSLIVLINFDKNSVQLMSSKNMEVNFSEKEIEDLKKQVQQKIMDGKFLEAMEIGE